jgi:hypothetical protein
MTTTPRDEKAERLAAALRTNLRRRKAQARGLAPDTSGAALDQVGDASGDGTSGDLAGQLPPTTNPAA